MHTAPALVLLALAARVYAHGVVVRPEPRRPGPAFAEVCGEDMKGYAEEVPQSPIEAVANWYFRDFPPNCDLSFCKGYQFDDNKNMVHHFSPAETITFNVAFDAGHIGVANISIVDVESKTLVGEPLITWEEYANHYTGILPEHKDFNITMPSSIDGIDCSTEGKCALQWWWYSAQADQTYMSCIDFTFAASQTKLPVQPWESKESSHHICSGSRNKKKKRAHGKQY